MLKASKSQLFHPIRTLSVDIMYAIEFQVQRVTSVLNQANFFALRRAVLLFSQRELR